MGIHRMSSQITTNQTPFPAFVSFVEDNLGFGGILSTLKRTAGSREWQPINGRLQKTIWSQIKFCPKISINWSFNGFHVAKQNLKHKGVLPTNLPVDWIGALPKVKNFGEVCGLLKAWIARTLKNSRLPQKKCISAKRVTETRQWDFRV